MGIIKKIIWIDDNESMMKTIISEVFEDLWQMQIRSEIFIMGDDWTSAFPVEHGERIADLNRVTYDKFISFLISKGCIDNEEVVKSYWHLINNSQEIQPNSDVVSNQNALLEKYNSIVDKWKEDKFSNDMPSTEIIVENILKKALNNKEDVSAVMVMIDLCLLKGDYRKLSSDDELLSEPPVFSMALYNEFLKRGLEKQIGLYSTFVVPNDVVKRWENIYYMHYEKKDFTIYNRRGIPYDDNYNKETLINHIERMG